MLNVSEHSSRARVCFPLSAGSVSSPRGELQDTVFCFLVTTSDLEVPSRVVQYRAVCAFIERDALRRKSELGCN